MFVEQQVERVEGRPRYLPMMLLVHVAETNRIREELIQRFDGGGSRLIAQAKWIASERPECLGHLTALTENRLGLHGVPVDSIA
jgi:hypothetical protein